MKLSKRFLNILELKQIILTKNNLIFLIFLLCSCQNTNKTHCSYFEKARDIAYMDSLIYYTRYDGIEQKNICCYEIGFKYWKNFPLIRIENPKYLLQGVLCFQDDFVFFYEKNKLNIIKNDSFILNMKFDMIDYINENLSNEYLDMNCFIEDVFWDNKYETTIYKLKIFEYPFYSSTTDKSNLVVFGAAEIGVVGAYLSHSTNSGDHLETIFSFTGEIFSSRYKTYIDSLSTFR